MPVADLKRMFDEADRNKDKLLDFDEFYVAVTGTNPLSCLSRAMRVFDRPRLAPLSRTYYATADLDSSCQIVSHCVLSVCCVALLFKHRLANTGKPPPDFSTAAPPAYQPPKYSYLRADSYTKPDYDEKVERSDRDSHRMLRSLLLVVRFIDDAMTSSQNLCCFALRHLQCIAMLSMSSLHICGHSSPLLSAFVTDSPIRGGQSATRSHSQSAATHVRSTTIHVRSARLCSG